MTRPKAATFPISHCIYIDVGTVYLFFFLIIKFCACSGCFFPATYRACRGGSSCFSSPADLPTQFSLSFLLTPPLVSLWLLSFGNLSPLPPRARSPSGPWSLPVEIQVFQNPAGEPPPWWRALCHLPGAGLVTVSAPPLTTHTALFILYSD